MFRPYQAPTERLDAAPIPKPSRARKRKAPHRADKDKPGVCELCGEAYEKCDIHKHHIRTRGAGGEDFEASGECNYVWLCCWCHLAAHAGNVAKGKLSAIAKKRDKHFDEVEV